MRYWIFVVIVLCLCVSAVLLARHESSPRSTSTDNTGTVAGADNIGARITQLEMRLAVLERRVAELQKGNLPKFVPVK